MSFPNHYLENKHIVVAGAGVSGLAFAISLHKQWPGATSSNPPRITLYERDPCAVPKDREGYSLSLRSDHPSTGIQTLQKMGLLDLTMERSVAAHGAAAGESQSGFCTWTVRPGDKNRQEKTWERVLKVGNKPPPCCAVSHLRITRAQLRSTLVEATEALPNVQIVWNTTVTSIQSPDTHGADQQIQAELSTGETVTADFIIAADGSSSKLRRQLRPSDKMNFAGPTCIFGRCPLADIHPSANSADFGCVISGTGKALFLAPVGGDSMLWSLSHMISTPSSSPAPKESAEELLAEARKLGREAYGPRFETLLEKTDKASLKRFDAWDKQPFAHANGYIEVATHKALEGKVVFIGDANHAVSPFAGNGANLALMDAWDLADSLVNGETGGGKATGECIKRAVSKYDGLACGRAKTVISRSHFAIRVMHSGGLMLQFWLALFRIIQWLWFEKLD